MKKSYQEQKRKHYHEQRKILDEAKKSSKIILSSSGSYGEMACNRCSALEQCREIVFTGQLLPCQTQNQEPIANMREHSDYSNWPTYQEYVSIQF